jgi:hypothetical protein
MIGVPVGGSFETVLNQLDLYARLAQSAYVVYAHFMFQGAFQV